MPKPEAKPGTETQTQWEGLAQRCADTLAQADRTLNQAQFTITVQKYIWAVVAIITVSAGAVAGFIGYNQSALVEASTKQIANSALIIEQTRETLQTLYVDFVISDVLTKLKERELVPSPDKQFKRNEWKNDMENCRRRLERVDTLLCRAIDLGLPEGEKEKYTLLRSEFRVLKTATQLSVTELGATGTNDAASTAKLNDDCAALLIQLDIFERDMNTKNASEISQQEDVVLVGYRLALMLARTKSLKKGDELVTLAESITRRNASPYLQIELASAFIARGQLRITTKEEKADGLKDLSRAKDILQPICDSSDDNDILTSGLSSLGGAQYSSEEFDAAEKTWNKAIAIILPNRDALLTTRLHSNIAFSYLRSNRLDEAIARWGLCKATNAYPPEADLGLAVAYYRKDQKKNLAQAKILANLSAERDSELLSEDRLVRLRGWRTDEIEVLRTLGLFGHTSEH